MNTVFILLHTTSLVRVRLSIVLWRHALCCILYLAPKGWHPATAPLKCWANARSASAAADISNLFNFCCVQASPKLGGLQNATANRSVLHDVKERPEYDAIFLLKEARIGVTNDFVVQGSFLRHTIFLQIIGHHDNHHEMTLQHTAVSAGIGFMNADAVRHLE